MPDSGNFRFTPFSIRQKQVLTWWTDNSPYRDYNGVIADGSIRAGKTLAMSISFVIWAMSTFDNMNFAICGKTIGSLRRNVINDLKRTAAGRGYRVLDKRGDNLLVITRGSRRNLFYLFGGRDESSQDLIQGITLAGCLFDEVALMPESFVNQATARCSVKGSKLFFNCNPADRLHWFKLRWINKYKRNRMLYIHFTMDDNPSLDVATKDRYANMYTGVFYRRYIEGLWVAAEGRIYDMWDPVENSYDQKDLDASDYANSGFRRYIAVDYGTANPMVFLDALDDGHTFWIRNEYYYDGRKNINQKSKTDAEYADDFEAFVGHDLGVTVIIDPSALSFRTELRNRGYRVKEADNDVINGIRVMSTLIKKRMVRIQRGMCPNFEREIESYVWDEKAAQRGDERPVKENDHAMDAARYLIKTLTTRRRLAQ